MKNLLAIDGTPINPIWAAEFRGLFWGEGHLSVTQHKAVWADGVKLSGFFYRSAAMIDLRADDTPLLIEIQRVLGGSLYLQHPKDEHPRKRWMVHSRVDNLRVCSVLSGGLLPAKKSREVELFTRAVELKGVKGQKLTLERKSELEKIYWELRGLRPYSDF